MFRYKLFLLLLFSFFYRNSSAQSIYAGGNGSGFGLSCYSQPSNVFLDLYKGGIADGFTIVCYSQADNDSFEIYSGGDANSFSITCYAQSDNLLYDIYKGGNSNSSSFLCYSQIDNPSFDIYKGGISNSFSVACHLQADNQFYDIYKGGNANSFSVTCHLQADNPFFDIYKGGNSNNSSTTCYTQLQNVLLDIYKGGTGNSSSTYCYTQLANVLLSIYKGGNSSGFSTRCYTQLQNVLLEIYKGGNADGFVTTCYLQADNVFYQIYRGGIADGFAFRRVGAPGSEVPLPIDLLFFRGTCDDQKIMLTWATASEIDNSYFEVQSSVDGLKWEPIGRVNGAGNSNGLLNYSLTSESILQDVIYYRLKQVDFDGDAELLEIIAVDNCNNQLSELLIYPNPGKGIFNLSFGENENDVRSIRVFNSLGDKVYVANGFNSILDLGDLPNGLYFIQLQLESKMISKKIMIEK